AQFQNHEGATPDLVPLPRRSGCRSRFRLIDHERVSSRQIQLKAQPGWLCGELARMRSLTMGAKNDHKGIRAAIRPFTSAIQRSDPICGAARAVSLPTRRDILPAQKRSDKHSSSRGGSFRLLQPILPGPKKGRELSANIGSTCARMPLRFRMLTPRRLVQFIRPNDCFIMIDLKDAYFHVPIHHRHRRYLRFAFGGIAYQFNEIPFGLALASRVFTKCIEAAIAPLRLRGLHVYNYLDDWLIASHSEAAAVQDGHLVVAHLYRLGFVINKEKSVLCPRQVTHFLGMILDSTSMEVRLSQERINAIKTCVRHFRLGQSVSSLRCQRLLGMMASAAIALPLGMLRMRPFQIWYLSMKRNAVTDRHRRVVVSSRCRKALAIWRTPWFLAASGIMGIVSRRVVVTTDASTTGTALRELT